MLYLVIKAIATCCVRQRPVVIKIQVIAYNTLYLNKVDTTTGCDIQYMGYKLVSCN